MFLKVVENLNTKLQLICYRMRYLTGLNYDALLADQEICEDQGFSGGNSYELDSKDYTMFTNAKELMIEAQYAAEAVKQWISVSSGNIPRTWHPGKEWNIPCNESIESITQLLSSEVYRHLENQSLNSLSQAFEFTCYLFKLLTNLQQAKECRLLYRNVLEEVRQAVKATNVSIHDFEQVRPAYIYF